MTSPRATLRPLGVLVALLTSVVLGGCSGPDPGAEPDAAASPAETGSSPTVEAVDPYDGYPDSMVVLGHSGATGVGSGDPDGQGSLPNNWATGSNPKVNSIYLRLQGNNDAIEGNAHNLAQNGADLPLIYEQAKAAINLEPAPELVLVQAIDNDIRCPAQDADLEAFDVALTRVLTTLTEGLPGSQVFLVMQDSAGPPKYAAVLTPEDRASLGGTGPCVMFDPDGRIVPEEIERLTSIVTRYDDRLASVCDQFERCHSDPAAFREVEERNLLAPDLNHLSVEGHARNADAAWSALARAGLIPADD
jgi:hypothetical protein